MEAGTLGCPRCGASVAEESVNCGYCLARLQTSKCRRCAQMMWHGERFCPHCGSLGSAIDVGTITQSKCPRCTTNLRRVGFAHANGEQCDDCGGLWLPAIDFLRLCEDADQQTASIAPSVQSNHPIATRPSPSGFPPCPLCSQRMVNSSFARKSGVLINRCSDHGVWLDGGLNPQGQRDSVPELRQIIDFIRSGGLIRARRVEIERLEASRRRLAAEHKAASKQAPVYRDLGPGGLSDFLNLFDL